MSAPVVDLSGVSWPADALLLGAVVRVQPPDGLALDATFYRDGRYILAIAYMDTHDEPGRVRDRVVEQLSRGILNAIGHPE